MDETDPHVANADRTRRDSIAAELRWISWLLLVIYALVAGGVIFLELRSHNSFYPPLFRTQYGVFALPVFAVAWLVFLIIDLRRRFRWKWLAGMIAAAALNLVAYMLIDAHTHLPG
jgi:hypothetical protein